MSLERLQGQIAEQSSQNLKAFKFRKLSGSIVILARNYEEACVEYVKKTEVEVTELAPEEWEKWKAWKAKQPKFPPRPSV